MWRRVWNISRITLAAILLAGLGAYHWPSAGYDIERVHPRLRSLREPLEYVGSTMYLDGGSLAFRLIDADNSHLTFSLPVKDGPGTRQYETIIWDTLDPRPPDVVPGPLASDDSAYIVNLLDRYGDFRDYSTGPRVALAYLRIHVRDWVRIIWHDLRSDKSDEAMERSHAKLFGDDIR